MLSTMGRPKEHDEQTAQALIASAERIIERDGADGLSVRGVAEDVGTTTRAVYALFGSKDGLVRAVAGRAFERMDARLGRLRLTDDPAHDLVEAGVRVFRRFACEQPALYRLAVQRVGDDIDVRRGTRVAAAAALVHLDELVARLPGVAKPARNGSGVSLLTLEFNAMCEGLAAMELRGVLPRGKEERIWREGLTALTRGLSAM
jgi:AcrR family transcriptional regulator